MKSRLEDLEDCRLANLDDLLLERWLRQRESKDIIWKTKDGIRLPIQEMTDSHLKNAIECARRRILDNALQDEMIGCEVDALD